MNTLHPNFLNENSFRSYPFTDDGNAVSESGFRIPDSVFLDLIIVSPDPGPVFMTGITEAGEVIFASAAGEIGRALVTGPGTFPVYGGTVPLGALTTGGGWELVKAAGPLAFTGVPVAAACTVTVPDHGVRSLVPDTGFPVSGRVKVTAGLGTKIAVDPETKDLVIDFEGIPDAVDPCTGLNYIRKILVEVWSSSMFRAADVDGAGTVSVSYEGKTLDQVCEDANAGTLPDSYGNLPRSPDYAGNSPAAAFSGESGADAPVLVSAFEIDVAEALGCVTMASFPAAGESPSRLRITGSGNRVEFRLLGA